MSNKTDNKISLKEAFAEYAKQELDFIKKADPNKVYHRVLPNIKDKEKGYIDFLYKKIVIGGSIDKDTIYLNKLRVTKECKESDIDEALNKIKELITSGDMKLVNNIE